MNPARPTPGVRIIALESLGDPGGRAVDFRDGDALFSVIVARRGAEVRAYENFCPHAGAPMERPDGRVVMQGEGRFVVCTAHGASFALDTGACVGGPGGGPLTPFAIEVRDGVVYAA